MGISILLASCGQKPFYEEYQAIPKNGWHQDSTIVFSVDVEDTTQYYSLMVNLRNNNTYPFQNIYLFRQVSTAQGIEFSDTAQYMLANLYGKWLGRGTGEVKTNIYPFKNQALRFTRKGKYSFIFQQAMRTERLEGIEHVGLTIYKEERETPY